MRFYIHIPGKTRHCIHLHNLSIRCVEGAQTCTGTWRPEVNIRYLPVTPSLSSEAECLSHGASSMQTLCSKLLGSTNCSPPPQLRLQAPRHQTGGILWSVNFLLSKHEDLTSTPRIHAKKKNKRRRRRRMLGTVAPTCNLSTRKKDRQNSGTLDS